MDGGEMKNEIIKFTDLVSQWPEKFTEVDGYGQMREFFKKVLTPEIKQELSRWIPVGERLPDVGDIVDGWVFPLPGMHPQDISKGRRVIDLEVGAEKEEDGKPYTFFKKHTVLEKIFAIPENYDISHWMPKPEPPKGE